MICEVLPALLRHVLTRIPLGSSTSRCPSLVLVQPITQAYRQNDKHLLCLLKLKLIPLTLFHVGAGDRKRALKLVSSDPTVVVSRCLR